ncbi:cell division protein [Bifidobacterium biavatii DSM 23969]|uniref:Cell division protein n=2 Tax=Bifidobacterium biavatii TaxID=762212 RepID=A0A086ZT46_9BIFI|nr:cell division protein [Bifidobacterium biavatii DSM 23969]
MTDDAVNDSTGGQTEANATYGTPTSDATGQAAANNAGSSYAAGYDGSTNGTSYADASATDAQPAQSETQPFQPFRPMPVNPNADPAAYQPADQPIDPSVYQQAGQSYAQDAQSTGASSSNAISDANGANGDAGQADGQTDANGANRPAFLMDSLPDLREQSGDGSTDGDTDGANPRDEFTTVYDILDQMESMLEEAKTSFFAPGVVKVDRDEFVGHLDDLKKMLPVQLERASALMREAERRLESAQTQANAIIASAQSRAADMVKDANDQAQFLAGQENVTELARQKARAILDQAQAKADRLTQGADKYCTTVMEGLQQQLGKLDRDVQAGLNVLYERQRTAGEQLPHLNNNDYPES